MRYALNAAPINGWETHQGSGQADQAISAAGVGHAVIRDTGSAYMALSASGNGMSARLGAGSAPMALYASGIGYAMLHGFGAADQALTATGDGKIIPFMGGQARLVMTATGNGVVSPAMIGMALLRLAASDGSMNSIAVRGNGEADLVLSGAYGIPNPPVTPTIYAATHNSRRLHVASELRRIRVEPERVIANPAERRRFGVAATNRSV